MDGEIRSRFRFKEGEGSMGEKVMGRAENLAPPDRAKSQSAPTLAQPIETSDVKIILFLELETKALWIDFSKHPRLCLAHCVKSLRPRRRNPKLLSGQRAARGQLHK